MCIDQNIINNKCCSCLISTFVGWMRTRTFRSACSAVLDFLLQRDESSAETLSSVRLETEHLPMKCERSTWRALSACQTWINTAVFFRRRQMRAKAGREKLEVDAILGGVLRGRKWVWWMGWEPLKWHWQKGRKSDYHLEGRKCIRGDSLGLRQVKCRDLGGVNCRLGL